MSNFHTLWQQQCQVWIQSINRNRTEGSIAYDFDQHRLTLVPRSCYKLKGDTWDTLYVQLRPLLDCMNSQLMEYDVRFDASYRLAPTICVDRIHIYLDGAEAITQLALVVDRELLLLKGGLKDRV